ADLINAFNRLVQSASQHASRQHTQAALHGYVAASSSFMLHLASACGRRSHKHARATAASEPLYAEQEGHHGVNTFTNYHNASGEGPAIAPAAWVEVSCKVYDPYIA